MHTDSDLFSHSSEVRYMCMFMSLLFGSSIFGSHTKLRGDNSGILGKEYGV